VVGKWQFQTAATAFSRWQEEIVEGNRLRKITGKVIVRWTRRCLSEAMDTWADVVYEAKSQKDRAVGDIVMKELITKVSAFEMQLVAAVDETLKERDEKMQLIETDQEKMAVIADQYENIQSLMQNLTALEMRLKDAVEANLQKGSMLEIMQKVVSDNDSERKKLIQERTELINKISALELEFKSTRAEINDLLNEKAELVSKISGLELGFKSTRAEINALLKMQEFVEDKITTCRKLIQNSQNRIAGNHLVAHRIITKRRPGNFVTGLLSQDSGDAHCLVSWDKSTLGISLEEKADQVVISYVIVDGPAFNSKMINKGDTIVAVDGQVLKHDAVTDKLHGKPGTFVTLAVKKGGAGKPLDVTLQRVSTASIADKLTMFDLFSELEDQFQKIPAVGMQPGRPTRTLSVPASKDQLQKITEVGMQLVEDAFEFWSEMMIEQQEHDNRYLARASMFLFFVPNRAKN
jgi:hypothetical protein